MRIGRDEVAFAAMMALVLTGVAALFAPAPTWGAGCLRGFDAGDVGLRRDLWRWTMTRESKGFKIFVSLFFLAALLGLAVNGLDPAGLETFAMFDNPTRAAWIALWGSYFLLLAQIWLGR